MVRNYVSPKEKKNYIGICTVALQPHEGSLENKPRQWPNTKIEENPQQLRAGKKILKVL